MCKAHDEVAALSVVVKDEEGSAVVNDDVRLRLPVRILTLASIEESITLQIKDAFHQVGRLVYLWLLLCKQVLQDSLFLGGVVELADDILQLDPILIYLLLDDGLQRNLTHLGDFSFPP